MHKKVLDYLPWIGLSILLAIPLLTAQRYLLHLLIMSMHYAIIVIGLNLVTGFTGQLSLGHAGLYGIGAYTSALLSTSIGVPFWFSVLMAACVCAVAGVILGAPSMRLRAQYLLISTVAFGEIVFQIARNWDKVTKGPTGIRNIPLPDIAGFVLKTPASWYYLVLVFFLLAIWTATRIVNSHVGRALKGIREEEIAAQVMGINTNYYKVLIFVVSAIYAGVAGSLYAHIITFIAPDNFTINESISFLTMMVIGGIGTIPGAVVGSFLITILPESLRALGDVRLVLYGLSLVLFMLFMPQGLVPYFTEIMERMSKQRSAGELDKTSKAIMD
jgi:branched-chain amino acid transport system permease protein